MDITQIITAIIGLIAAVLCTIITKVVVPWIESKTSETTQAILETAARSAVLYVQQVAADSANEDKLDVAVTKVTAWLSEYGITMDEGTIQAAIEAALKALKLEAGEAWK